MRVHRASPAGCFRNLLVAAIQKRRDRSSTSVYVSRRHHDCKWIDCRTGANKQPPLTHQNGGRLASAPMASVPAIRQPRSSQPAVSPISTGKTGRSARLPRGRPVVTAPSGFPAGTVCRWGPSRPGAVKTRKPVLRKRSAGCRAAFADVSFAPDPYGFIPCGAWPCGIAPLRRARDAR